MAKILFIIAPKNFRDEELIEPRNLLASNNTIDIASTVKGECKGMLGARIPANLTLKEAQTHVSEYAAAIFVGGSGSQVYHNDPLAHTLARVVASNPHQILAAICWGVITLAKAGVLSGKKITGWVSPSGEEKKIFAQANALYQPTDVVSDGNIITANGPHAATEFGRTIKKHLAQS